jgi:hypothetical protein
VLATHGRGKLFEWLKRKISYYLVKDFNNEAKKKLQIRRLS